MNGKLYIGAACFHADFPHHGDRGVAHPLVFLVAQRLRRGHRDRVARMHAHGVEVLDGAHDDEVVGLVADDLELVLLPPEDALLDEHLVRGGLRQRPGDLGLELVLRAGDAPAASAQTPSIYIPLISKGFQHQFWQAVKVGAEKAAKDYKVTINVEPHGPYTNDPEFMLNLFKHFDSEYLRCNFDTGNSFIAGHDPLKYLKTLRPYVTHLHIKDVAPELAAAVRGEETGIGSSVVPVGGGVNAENIRKCMEFLHKTKWSGAVSIECHGSDENTKASVLWMRGVLKSLKK